MRRRIAFALLTATSLTLLVIGRHHLLELSEVLSTYTKFYHYLKHHPDILYRHGISTVTQNLPVNASKMIPPIIHQISLGDSRLASLGRYEAAINSCRAMHPYWTHSIWTDEEGSNFIEQYYPSIWPHYMRYKQSVQRANILRYALLDHFGGVYLDLDVTCLQPLDDLTYLPWLTPGAHPAGLNNAFMLSRPHHAFLKNLLAAVPSRDLAWGLPYVETMLSSGCMFLSNRWMNYATSLSRMNVSVPEEDKIYILADKDGRLEPHMLRGAVTTPLFRHEGASSWHRWDAAAIVLIGKYFSYFLAMVGIGILLAATVMWRSPKRNDTERQKWIQRKLRRTMSIESWELV